MSSQGIFLQNIRRANNALPNHFIEIKQEKSEVLEYKHLLFSNNFFDPLHRSMAAPHPKTYSSVSTNLSRASDTVPNHFKF